MSGFKIGIGVGISYNMPIRNKGGSGDLPEEESCFSTGVWLDEEPWLDYKTWKMNPNTVSTTYDGNLETFQF